MFDARKRNKRILLFTAYLFIGILIRLYYLWQFSESPLFNIPIGPDVEEYTQWANEILAGKYLWSSVNIHSPLYPYFLAFLCWLFSETQSVFGWIRFSQLLIGLFSVIPLFLSLNLLLDGKGLSGVRVISDKTTKVLFLFLWAFYPPLIFYMGELTSEVLLIPLLSLSIFFLYKSEIGDFISVESEEDGSREGEWNRGLLQKTIAGLCAGLAVIAHPLSLFFIIFETLYMFFLIFIKRVKEESRKKIVEVAMFAFFAIIPLIPVVFYNTLVVGGSAPLQANSGFNFYLGNGPGADGTCRIRPGPVWNKIHNKAESDADRLGISKDRYFMKTTLKHISSHPLHWLKLLSLKSLYVWNEKELTAGADVLPLRYFTAFQRYTRWSFGVVAVFAIIALILNIGSDLNGGEKNRFFYRYRHFLILLIAFWVAQTLLVTSGRYRIAMLPSVLVLASAGVASIICVLRNIRRRTLMLIPALGIAIGVVYLPTPPYHPVSEIAEAQTLFGEALIRQGRYSEAKGQLISAAKHQADWSRNYNLLGLISEKQENFDEAEQYYMRAVKSDPELPEGYVNIATLYSNRGFKERADIWFKKALSLKKANPELYYNYALYCSKKGDNICAVKYYQACIKLDSANSQALNNLGTIYFQKKEFKNAIHCFKTALRVDPQNPQRMINLALAYLEMGNKKAARGVLRKALKIAPELPAVHTLQAIIDQKK